MRKTDELAWLADVQRLIDAARGLLSAIDEHATGSFGDAEDDLREAISRVVSHVDGT